MNKYEFLHPYSRYHGEFTPENFLFDANLQEFARRVSYISSLENSGKLSPEEAYKQIKNLWKELKTSKKSLLDSTSPS